MKKIPCLLFFFAGSAVGSPVYLTEAGEPWIGNSNNTNMHAVFSTGNWDPVTLANPRLFDKHSDFIFIDTGDGLGGGFDHWMVTRGTKILAGRDFVTSWLASVNLTEVQRWGGGSTHLDINSFRAHLLAIGKDYKADFVAVPEPGYLTILGLGSAGLGFARKVKLPK
ncbi:PEP-CTERM sorting domain-containing protein [Marinobacter sp. chi1]|uniref:PEP-CTERM sorting domain-containing protein n=1 Tax=Marinobacter suaedae TaxID=3057675 RepID=A0ABT8VW10_9GAMM|nr:PEP-CTERM sorting domain-containing protein [Marinobacter sp. chi1]MDO3720128.1 PEP-CTERM sorting domain-containing protein [Marinobacter sp. chi1]